MTSNVFIPTFLYIKQHTITGKLYFGKTTKDPEKYLGSGKYWKDHINKHGIEHVVNLWYCLFLDKPSINEFALNFSKQHNITESSDWANLIPENGLDGGKNKFGGGYKGQGAGVPKSKEWKDKLKATWTTDRRKHQSDITKSNPNAMGNLKPTNKGKKAYNNGSKTFLLTENDPLIIKLSLIPGMHKRLQTLHIYIDPKNKEYKLPKTSPLIKKLSLKRKYNNGWFSKTDNPKLNHRKELAT